MKAVVWMFKILNAQLALWMSVSGQESTSSGRLQRSSHICVFGKKSHNWSNTECRPDVLLKHPEGCKLEQFEASRHKGRSGRKVLVVRTDDALDSWASGQYIKSSGRLQGIRFF